MTSLLALKDNRRSREKIGSVRALSHGTRSQYSRSVSASQGLDRALSHDANQPVSDDRYTAEMNFLRQAAVSPLANEYVRYLRIML